MKSDCKNLRANTGVLFLSNLRGENFCKIIDFFKSMIAIKDKVPLLNSYNNAVFISYSKVIKLNCVALSQNFIISIRALKKFRE